MDQGWDKTDSSFRLNTPKSCSDANQELETLEKGTVNLNTILAEQAEPHPLYQEAISLLQIAPWPHYKEQVVEELYQKLQEGIYTKVALGYLFEKIYPEDISCILMGTEKDATPQQNKQDTIERLLDEHPKNTIRYIFDTIIKKHTWNN